MKNVNRWFYAIIGVLVLLLAGMVYAWSILSLPIAAEFPEWTKAQLSTTFTIAMICFCLGGLIAGLLARRIRPAVFLWASAVLFLVGFLWASRAQSLMSLYLSFGVVCGLASGLAYNAVLGTVGKWFPDKQGLISGILLMGFGMSSFLLGKLYQSLTPDTIGAWRQSFLVMGIVMAVVVGVCGFLLRQPGADFRAPAGKAKKTVGRDVPTAQMLKDPAFWLFYLWAIVLSAAGLAIVSQASGMATEIGRNVPAATIATVVGLISIFNGIGRVIFGAMFDAAGRSRTMLTICAANIIAGLILIFALRSDSFTLLIVGFIAAGFAYGGATPSCSAMASAYWGMKYYPVNLSLIVSNLIFASFGSTIAGSLYDSTGSYMSIYFLVCGLAAVGIVISLGISACDKRRIAAQKGDAAE